MALNAAGYELAATGRRDAGLELLRPAVTPHPKEPNLYKSNGEFHLRKGQREQAREFYAKALEIDPYLASPRRALERLWQ